ncbi:MAG: hypothetical protein Q4F24_17660 [Eubacteriales bacterium]|nr:hypothetical protein [Eubacteriales bacterium]
MRIERLNLVMTYPVHWMKHEVMRDYIQNFFDAVGYERFLEDFSHTYDEERHILTMSAEKGFSMEWLLYIGASSKRGKRTGEQIGRYGEGFKIASLVAYRDFHYDIVMESKEWRIHVIQQEDIIDGKSVKVLSYEIEDRVFGENSVLILKNVEKEDYQTFLKAMNGFFYEGNPTFGKIIAKTDDYAIFSLSEGAFAKEGALFAGRLKRAELKVPLIVCNHRYRSVMDGRDREPYCKWEIEECLEDVLEELEPKAAYTVLCQSERYWNKSRKKQRYSINWEKLIVILIERVMPDKTLIVQFYQDYGEDLIADFEISGCGNRRRQALNWLHRSAEYQKRRLVISEFQELGIPGLNDLCRKCGGYELLRDADEREKRYLNILERIAGDVFDGYICYDSFPCCRIIKNQPPHAGAAHSIASKRRMVNCLGLKVKSDIRCIHLKASLLQADSFSMAVSVYMHELLHQFGGDSSVSFRKAIKAMSLCMIQKSDVLMKYQMEWEAVEKTNVGV